MQLPAQKAWNLLLLLHRDTDTNKEVLQNQWTNKSKENTLSFSLYIFCFISQNFLTVPEILNPAACQGEESSWSFLIQMVPFNEPSLTIWHTTLTFLFYFFKNKSKSEGRTYLLLFRIYFLLCAEETIHGAGDLNQDYSYWGHNKARTLLSMLSLQSWRPGL